MNTPIITFGEIMKLVVNTFANAFAAFALTIITLFVYLAFNSPDTFSQIACRAATSTYVDYVSCTIGQIL